MKLAMVEAVLKSSMGQIFWGHECAIVHYGWKLIRSRYREFNSALNKDNCARHVETASSSQNKTCFKTVSKSQGTRERDVTHPVSRLSWDIHLWFLLPIGICSFKMQLEPVHFEWAKGLWFWWFNHNHTHNFFNLNATKSGCKKNNIRLDSCVGGVDHDWINQ